MIRVLPKIVADKIAAGEVVDRPVSIVKELLENAIDAGAGSITIEIKNGGKTYIRVSDNGCGIHKQEAPTAFLRHATSKIQKADDLDQVMTLGFRGEALASIAAVSRMEMITKTADTAAGVSLRIEGGEILSITDVGCPDGTAVIVTDLFYNTPARLKFMKADGVESTQIIDFVSKMALAYSGIKIRMISNGSILFSTSGRGNISANITEIFGKEIGEKLIQYYAGEDAGGKVDIRVFVSPQSQTRSNKKYQIFFVNGRYVSSKLIENAIAAAYREKIPEGRFPVVFLFYDVNPAVLDVNIHPNKKEVRFADEKAVSEFITNTILRALDTTDAMPDIKPMQPDIKSMQPDIKPMPPEPTIPDHPAKTDIWQDSQAVGRADPEKSVSADSPVQDPLSPTDFAAFFAQKRVMQNGDPLKNNEQISMLAEQEVEYAPGTSKQKSDTVKREPDIVRLKPDISGIQVTGAIFDTYITGYDAKYFYLIDQHAAHERIFYEQLLAQFYQESKEKQLILTPILLEVPIAVKESDSKIIDYLKKFGFDIDAFGRKAYKISSIPIYMSIQEAEDFLVDFMDNISEKTDFTDQKKLDKIITGSCKKAVKAHDKLDISEMKRLMHDLARTKNPYACPHGRPVFLKLSKQEIEKMFKRS